MVLLGISFQSKKGFCSVLMDGAPALASGRKSQFSTSTRCSQGTNAPPAAFATKSSGAEWEFYSSLHSVQPTPRLSQGKHFTGCGRSPSVFPSYFSAGDTVFAGAIIPLIHWTHPDNPSLQSLGREQLEQGLSS